ncbi:MAG: hypothetical protein AAF664_01000 [Planctomycetota bacterium]
MIEQRTYLRLSRTYFGKSMIAVVAAAYMLVAAPGATAQPPRATVGDLDLEGSGFVMPAGGPMPHQAFAGMPPTAGGLQQASYQAPQAYGPVGMGLQQVGFYQPSGCDMGYCEGYGPGPCGMGCQGGPGCPSFMSGGVLGKMCGGSEECGGYRFDPEGFIEGILDSLRPYGEAGKCSQRWYDVSVEALWLGRTASAGGPNVITTEGIGGTPVITLDNALDEDTEIGLRISGAMLWGPGGNIEATYFGGQEWGDTTTALTTGGATGTLYSFISDFGVGSVGVPAGGFDDTDTSLSQSLTSSGDFHSGELNYRRRTVGPFCKFQYSWLFGLRYFRYDNNLSLDIVGDTPSTNEFFNLSDRAKNDLFGAQIGGDFWWNMAPGIRLGVEGKVAWMKNEISSNLVATSNSIAAGSIGSFAVEEKIDDGTLAGELNVVALYRLSHSWTARAGYYLVAIDEVAEPGIDGSFIRAAAISTATAGVRPIEMGSVVLNGFSFGAEYTW